jgi:hypothetical protein
MPPTRYVPSSRLRMGLSMSRLSLRSRVQRVHLHAASARALLAGRLQFGPRRPANRRRQRLPNRFPSQRQRKNQKRKWSGELPATLPLPIRCTAARVRSKTAFNAIELAHDPQARDTARVRAVLAGHFHGWYTPRPITLVLCGLTGVTTGPSSS